MNSSHIILGASCLLALVCIPVAEAKLWDVHIKADAVGEITYGGDFEIIGRILDHGGYGVPSTVEVRVGQYTIIQPTEANGAFQITINDNDLLTGTHIVNIRALVNDELKGMSSIEITAKGNFMPSDHTARLLESKQATKYLNGSIEDFEDEPFGANLFDYYQSLKELYEKQQTQEAKALEERNKQEELQAQATLHRENELNEERNKQENQEHQARQQDQKFLDGIKDKELQKIFKSQLEQTRELGRILDESIKSAPDHDASTLAMQLFNQSAGISKEKMQQFTTHSTE